MDFIERLLGISPDGGSGSLELLLFAILICGNIYLAVKRRLRKQRMPQPAPKAEPSSVNHGKRRSYRYVGLGHGARNARTSRDR